jgi:hypothetical protein
VDLQLSGHTHNGQVFPANILVMPIEYELAHGIKLKRNTLFIVSSGVHFSDLPINTAGFSEILHINAIFRSDIRKPTASWHGIFFKRSGYELLSQN